METKITAILPCYNIEKYLGRCLDSIINQDFPYWEAIIIDDGSTDNSLKIAERYASIDKRILVYHFDNQGVSQARNEGIKHANGELLHFIDPDDWIEPNCFSKCYEIYQKYSPDCIHFNKYIHRWDTDNKLSDGELDFKILTNEDIYKEYTTQLIGISQVALNHWYKGEDIWKYKKPWQGWSFMFSKKVIESNDIKFQSSLKTSEDALFVVEYSIYSKKMVRIADYLYNYDFRKDGTLFNRVNERDKLFADKYSLIIQRERIRILVNKKFPNKQDFIYSYLGSHVFSCLELLIKLCQLKKGFQQCNAYITNPYVQESIKRVNLKNAPLKFKIPVLFLKKHCQYILFTFLRIYRCLGGLKKQSL